MVAALALAAEPGFRRRVGQVDVDWTAATVTAQGGAAADLRMPGPNAARPGAERRARAAAVAKLRGALSTLVAETAIDEKKLGEQAEVGRIEYQSNGGVVLWLTARLADLVAVKPAAVSLRVPSMPFTFVPSVSAAGKTARLGLATYRSAAEAPKDAVRARADRDGRLILGDHEAKLVDSLAGRAVVIYLEKPQP